MQLENGVDRGHALVGFGLVAAGRLRAGRAVRAVRAGRAQVAAGVAGGLVVIRELHLERPLVLDGGVPTAFPWPVFAAGLGFAAWGATTAFQRVPPRPGGRTGR